MSLSEVALLSRHAPDALLLGSPSKDRGGSQGCTWWNDRDGGC